MQQQNNDLQKYLHRLTSGDELPQEFRQAVKQARDGDVSRLFVNHAKAAGFEIRATDIDTLIRESKQTDQPSGLSDEDLDQVSGGAITLDIHRKFAHLLDSICAADAGRQ